MTLEEFLKAALAPDPHQRRGQRFANHLVIRRMDLANEIPPEIDPYYKDGNLWAAVAWVRDNWDNPVQSSSTK